MRRKLFAITATLLALTLVVVSTAQESDVAAIVKAKVAAAKSQVDSIAVADLKAELASAESPILIDVRTEAELRAGHIPGARWVPRGMLEFVAAKDSLAPTNANLVVYCKKDSRGSLSAQALQELGFGDVKYVVGGYEKWAEAGYPVDTGMSPVKFTEEGVGMQLTSSAFTEGALIPAKYTCDDADISPPLAISGVPENALSLALICDDPDAPMGVWVHWVLYNLPVGTTELQEKFPTDAKLPDGTCQGISDFGRSGYGGPCPPGGTHRYFFKLYALDKRLDLTGKVKKADLIKAMEGHVLAEAQLMGKYSRK